MIRSFYALTPSPLSVLALGVVAWTSPSPAAEPPKVEFNKHVLPILAENCFKCHGMDEKARKGDLRLDHREDGVKSGAIVPGDPTASEMIQRILTGDEDDLMPPREEHRPLSQAQIAILQRWISEGAPYERHWSFIPPQKPPVPEVAHAGFEIRNAVDAFVLARLDQEHLEPATPAQREDWLRRVTFDLSGLPPTLAEIDDFLADTSEGAFARVVDRLLNSKTYGEHMAVSWLDVARYADTYGRHEDHDSLTWPYRDWVIRAFNSNMPYDQFVTWQTAGDMLPHPTQDMYLATMFNRLPQQSNEAGVNEDEYRQDIIADRVRSNGIAFLGLSLECARCHDHKYDPISTRDYYSLSAFLNNIDESGVYTVYTHNIPAPSLLVYEGNDEWEHTSTAVQVSLKEKAREALLTQAHARFDQWLLTGPHKFTPAKPVAHLPFDSDRRGKEMPNLADPSKPATSHRKLHEEQGEVGEAVVFNGECNLTIPGVGVFGRTQPFSFSCWLKPSQPLKRAVVVTCSYAGRDAGSMGYELILEDDRPSFALCHFWPGNAVRIRTQQPLPLNAWTHIGCTYDGSSRASGLHIYVNGMAVPCDVIRDHLYKDIINDPSFSGKDGLDLIGLSIGGRHNDAPLAHAAVDDFKLWDCEITPVEMRLMSKGNQGGRDSEWFTWWLRDHDELWRKASADLRAARDAENDIANRVKEVMVMREIPEDHRRPTYVLTRGNVETPAERVMPDVPASVFPLPAEFPRTRLSYASWLVDRRNPLTARVFVNRVWQQFFGRGLVLTSEDFGVQGQPPSHPELLDWLATWFMDNRWDVKELCRLIALSSTYRQSSLPHDPALLRDDPENRLLARGPRVRLTAEQLRDNMLAVSGLLNPKLGGPPVNPYQPAGLWEDSGTQHSYVQSRGADLYRRSCYTFWRRTLPPPAMTVFDAPTREFCKARRDRSSSPLQALVLFNDPQFLEPARVLAENLVREFPGDDVQRAQSAARRLLGRLLPEQACGILVSLLRDERAYYRAAPQEACALREKNGATPFQPNLDAVEVAATTLMVRGLLAFDECVMKP